MIPNYNYSTGYPNPYQRPVEMSNGIQWVQGIEGAKAFQLTPNSNVLLMDSENDGIFYIKITDNIGMANLRVFRYVEITSQDVRKDTQTDLSEYVKKSELKELIVGLTKEINDEQSISATKSDRPKPLIKG